MSAHDHAAPAYRVHGEPVDAAAFYRVACDPHRSVVIEACAGAGKTWMLVARILRALLEGVEPSQILAITFTRKAAGEMRGRLQDLLEEMALAGVEDRVAALRERGLDVREARAVEPRLAGLAEQVLDSGRGVEIRTFHGWFGQLLRAAPAALLEGLGLTAELALLEDTEDIEPRLWRRFLQAVADDAGLRADHTALIRQRGRAVARDWLRSALEQRVEIERADEAGTLERSVPSAAEWAPAFAVFDDPNRAVLADPLRSELLMLGKQLARGGKKARDAATQIEAGLAGTDAAQSFETVWSALHTKDGEPRKLGSEVDDAFVATCTSLAQVREAVEQQAAHEEHLRLVRLSRVLLGCYRALKREEGLADMADLETVAERLLGDATLSGWLQERLDARVAHLLIDEFQDTNPTQWRALHAWLAGYAGAGGGASGQRPLSVFLVGDPKQSIYRFRRADPRVFAEARRFVEEALSGTHLSCDHTRRCAPALIDAVNAVFGAAQADGEFEGFRDHTTKSDATGRVRCLPVVTRPDRVAKPATPTGWRDSLTTPRVEAVEDLHLVEARHVAAEIARSLVGADGQPPCAPGEIMVLARKRTSLAHVAQALHEIGIPFNAPTEQVVADLPEARDVIALLDVLVSPHHDLSLAHALRSPMFGAEDEDLQVLALAVRERREAELDGEAADASWWAALTAGAGPGRPALERARALLPAWAAAARVLPPHDLLDRLYDEGDLPARTAAAVPEAQRALALATLDALLGLALDLDGGRYATPYGFVRALKRRPLRLALGMASQAVQLLTIHGAKGLEADAVLLVDGLPEAPRSETATLLIDWPAEARHPVCCAFVASEARCPPSLRGLQAQELEGRAREELNGLYVAMTRARRQLVVSATRPHRPAASRGPWDRLAAAGAMVQHMQERPEPPVAANSAPVPLRSLPRFEAMPPAEAPRGSFTEVVESDAQRLGRAVHRVLEWQPSAGRLDAACASACAQFGLAPTLAAEVRRVVGVILGNPDCVAFFDPGRLDWAANEMPLSWQGESLRLDRLVRRRDSEGRVEWWVLDYKLQAAPHADEGNLAQLARYREAVQALQPGEVVRAAFIGGDGALWVLP